jgi:hypothetical protein
MALLPRHHAGRQGAVEKADGGEGTLLGEGPWPSPFRTHTVALLIIEPLGLEKCARKPEHCRAIEGISPTNDRPNWFNV